MDRIIIYNIDQKRKLSKLVIYISTLLSFLFHETAAGKSEMTIRQWRNKGWIEQ